MNCENKFLIDWLSFTSKFHSFESIISLLGLSNLHFIEMYGMYGYSSRYYFGGISIHYNSSRSEGIFVDMCGEGCRTFETYSKIDFIELLYILVDDSDLFNVTRLDVAYDTFDDSIPILKFRDDVNKLNYVSRFHERSITLENHPGDVGYTIYLGSSKSDIRFRCYDKAYQLGYVGEDYFNWIRFEMQLRRDRAENFIKLLNTENVGKLFSGVLYNYFRVVVPDLHDSNKRRWKLRPWFKKFLSGSEQISLFTKCDKEYNLSKCEDYVYRMAGNAVDTLIKIKGFEVFSDELRKNKPDVSEKYLKLLNDCQKIGV